jgi:hypothetical protein
MADLDLRPLSLGEILDRTFTLYRRHFVLFLGITALPHLLILGLNLAETLVMKMPAVPGKPPVEQFQGGPSSGLLAFGVGGAIIGFIVYMVAYLFSQGGTIYAVSELYLGRTTTIGASLRRMWGQLANLFGVTILNGLVILLGTLCLIIPGIYIACRLIICVPAALLEDLGARESLGRSFDLTKNFAGRAFVIGLLYFGILYSASALLMMPFTVGMFVAIANHNLGMLRLWSALMNTGSSVVQILVSPILLIATSVFYFDLRVRKEAFDLQLMMNPSGALSAGNPSVPSILS